MYIIMKEYQSPIYRTEPKVHGYVDTLKKAREITDILNKKAMSNQYWYVKAKKLSE